MDQRQGQSPPVYPPAERSPRAPEDVQSRGSSTCPQLETLHHHNHNDRHRSSPSLPPSSPFPQYPSPIPRAQSSITATPSPRSLHLPQQSRRQHRDLDRLDVATRHASPSVDGDGHLVDPWPRMFSSLGVLSVASSAAFSPQSSSPFARPVIYDRGTYDHPNFPRHANPGEPEGGRIQELAPGGGIGYPPTYEEIPLPTANRRLDWEPAPLRGDGGEGELARHGPRAAAVSQRNPSLYSPSQSQPHLRAHPYPHLPHRPHDSSQALLPHESGSQSAAAVVRVDSPSAHSRRHDDRIESLDRRHPRSAMALSSPPSAPSDSRPSPFARSSTPSSSPSLHRGPLHVFAGPAARSPAGGEDRAAAGSPFQRVQQQQQRLTHAYPSPHVVDHTHGKSPRADTEDQHRNPPAPFSLSRQRQSLPFVAHPHQHPPFHPSRSGQGPEEHLRHHSTGNLHSPSHSLHSPSAQSSSPLPPPSSPPPSLNLGPLQKPFDDHGGEENPDRQQQPHGDDERGFDSSSSQDSWARQQLNSPLAGDLHHKFGTDMPTTVDLKSAIETCDVLCKFALHYAVQDSDETRHSTGYDDRSMDPHYRTTLQMIRNMNLAILTGLQTPGDGRGADGESNPQEGEPQRFSNLPMAGGAMRPDNEDGERPPRFGPGPPPSEMVHELARAATSIFQLAIRIKAWVTMTPEERQLDEEINIIRGKRCVFMDGTATSVALPVPDTLGHQRQGNEWAADWGPPREDGYAGQYDRSKSFDGGSFGQHVYRRPGDLGEDRRMLGEQDQSYKSQFSTPYGSYKPMASPQGGMAVSFGDKGLMRTKSSSNIKAMGSDTGDVPHQKYRKRAKRTHPPGRCLSCDSSDTPEWRRGPDGARTLCNACGLHYAKLLKRQNEQQKLLNGGQGGSSGANAISTTAIQSSLTQLQGINFQLRRRPKSLTPDRLAAEAGAGPGPESRSGAASAMEMAVDQNGS